jgi:hypothetical protein
VRVNRLPRIAVVATAARVSVAVEIRYIASAGPWGMRLIGVSGLDEVRTPVER